MRASTKTKAANKKTCCSPLEHSRLANPQGALGSADQLGPGDGFRR